MCIYRRRVKPPHQKRQSAFTLIELVVVVAVLALLASLLVPAVQNVRESARRMHCASNVKQLMLAVNNYESTYGAYPSVVFRMYWPKQLLPYLDGHSDASSSPIYMCPTDPEATGHWSGYYMSFYPNEGLGPSANDGFLVVGRVLQPRDITDGLSHTAAFAERLALPHLTTGEMLPPDNFRHLWNRRVRRTPVFLTDFDRIAEQCERHAGAPIPFYYGFVGYNHILTPNRPSCANGPLANLASFDYYAITVSSLHSGGVNVAAADGAVRFVSDSIDRRVWRAIGTRAGGESISNSGFAD